MNAHIRYRLPLLSLLAGCAFAAITVPAADPLTLARDGHTGYAVVTPDAPSTVDALALRTLTNVLFEATSTLFPVVPPSDIAPDAPAIFVGLSAPALARLGEPDPLTGLADEEHVARSQGADIFLYGQGARGNLYAVMDFLEHSLDWRWFSLFAHPIVPERPTLALQPFARRRGFSFPYRETLPIFDHRFFFLHGVNLTWAWQRHNARWEDFVAQGILPALDGQDRVGGCHSFFQYIPPRPDAHLWAQYQWITNRNYYATNPEFFSMNEGGTRVTQQLCFSSRALRDTFTATVLEHVERLGPEAIVTVGAEDTGGVLCHCEGCQAFDAQYDAPSGGYFDYLLELCGIVAERHPGARVKGVAYRREQTQRPPTLPDGGRFPDNFVILFAPIDDPYLGDWSQPDPGLQQTYRDLQDWGKIAPEIWVFYYPSPYGTGQVMPAGNVQRLVTAMRLMHAAGVRGIFSEEAGALWGTNFSELHPYLFFKLTQDIDADVDALIRDFTDAQYGPAGELARTYLHELEQGRLDIEVMPQGMTYSSRTFDPAFWPYLTPENLRRWQGYFDEMERLCAAQPTALANVRRLRRNLDFAILFKWLELAEAFPDDFSDHTVHAERIRAVNADPRPDLPHTPRPVGERTISIFESIIRGGGEKPLPAEFDDIDPQRIRTSIPQMDANDRYHQGYFDDPEAAFGYAPSAHRAELPFTFGFYQSDTRTHGQRRTIDPDEITPGVYRLYKLGTVTMSHRSQIWFGRSWSTKVVLEDLWEPGDPNLWDAYASIKFQGPMYGGEPVEGLRSDEVDLVLIDRVILVKHEDVP